MNLEKEVSQKEFDVSVFLNRLTNVANVEPPAKTPGASSNPFQEFMGEPTTGPVAPDPEKLSQYFETTIQTLQQLKAQYEHRVADLQAQAEQEERRHLSDCVKLQKNLNESSAEFQVIHANMQNASNNIAALSVQLADENTPKKRILEAKDMITDFYRFYSGVTFSWAPNRESTLAAAEKMQKLVVLCMELPDDPAFMQAKKRISDVSAELDSALLTDFKEAFGKGDIEGMRSIVKTFEKSKNFTLCMEQFVSEYLKNVLSLKELQACVFRLAAGTEKCVVETFPQPASVSNRLIQGIFAIPIKEDISKQLEIAKKSSEEEYLVALYNNYTKLKTLCDEVNRMERCLIDRSLLQKHFKELFQGYLKNYMNHESRWLSDRFAMHLHNLYEGLEVNKRDLNAGGLSEFRRDFWGMDLTSNEMNKILLSEEMTVNMLDEARMAAQRCKALSDAEKMAFNAKCIFDTLVQHLIEGHVSYGLDIAIYAIPTAAPKSEPSILFFEVVWETNKIFHFFEKAVTEYIAPLLSNTVHWREFQEKRTQLTRCLEGKVNVGLERCLTVCQAYVQHLLTTEQKRTDFEAAETNRQVREQSATPACKKVCRFVRKVCQEIQIRMDGRNVGVVLHEFALRFHRALVEHFYKYTYNSFGGITAMMDVTEYKEVFHDASNPETLVAQLFRNLHKLINILSMDPKNLKQIFQEYEQLGISRELFMNFVQLRSDFKSERLASVLK